jgi:hypothetical protein
LGGAASEVEAVAGRAGSLGGLSVPATWTAGGAGVESASTARAVAPVAASGGGTSAAAAPATTGGSGMYGGTPMAAGMHGRGTDSDGTPRYGKPVKVLRRR